jgi:hypothetical protein
MATGDGTDIVSLIDYAVQIKAIVSKGNQAVNILKQVANGDENTDVATDNGLVPSYAKIIKYLTDQEKVNLKQIQDALAEWQGSSDTTNQSIVDILNRLDTIQREIDDLAGRVGANLQGQIDDVKAEADKTKSDLDETNDAVTYLNRLGRYLVSKSDAVPFTFNDIFEETEALDGVRSTSFSMQFLAWPTAYFFDIDTGEPIQVPFKIELDSQKFAKVTYSTSAQVKVRVAIIGNIASSSVSHLPPIDDTDLILQLFVPNTKTDLMDTLPDTNKGDTTEYYLSGTAIGRTPGVSARTLFKHPAIASISNLNLFTLVSKDQVQPDASEESTVATSVQFDFNMDLSYRITFDRMVIANGATSVGLLTTQQFNDSSAGSKQSINFTDVRNDPVFSNISSGAWFGLSNDSVGRIVSIYGKIN